MVNSELRQIVYILIIYLAAMSVILTALVFAFLRQFNRLDKKCSKIFWSAKYLDRLRHAIKLSDADVEAIIKKSIFSTDSEKLARLGGFEGVERRKCLKINARVF
jgi:biopolymer transport protein ExbB/TolQ